MDFINKLDDFLKDYANGSYDLIDVIDSPDGYIITISTKLKGRSDRSKRLVVTRLLDEFKDASKVIVRESEVESNLEKLLFIPIKSSIGVDPIGLNFEIEKNKAKIELTVKNTGSGNNEDIEIKIKDLIHGVLSPIGISISSLSVIVKSGSKIPNPLIIKSIIVLAPVDFESLYDCINERYGSEYEFNHKVLRRIIDDLRKEKLVVWSPNGYLASPRAIDALSGSKSRNSLDIQRALNMKFQQW